MSKEEMEKSEESTDILSVFVSTAIDLGANKLEIEYDGSREEVMAIKGSMGIGIGALETNSKEAVALRDELWKHRRKMKKIEIGGVNYTLKVKTYNSFGEMAFRVEIKKV